MCGFTMWAVDQFGVGFPETLPNMNSSLKPNKSLIAVSQNIKNNLKGKELELIFRNNKLRFV